MNQYLEVPFREKDAAKALGARWDGGAKKWFVPEGTALTPFRAWLPAAAASDLAERFDAVTELTTATSDSRALATPDKGITLSQLLAGVTQLVANAYKSPVWTMVEVVEVSSRNGHVYLDLSERSVDGRMLARAKGMIWASTAQAILPQFERATGAQLAPGIKLLVRGRPVFKSEWGFSIEIDAIDSEYTLGDLEAKKREIRTRLQKEGVFDANRRLPGVWDFNAVLVVAPEMAAGLGDFQAEAQRLAHYGICRFVYVHSRFQGEGAPEQIRKALLDGLQAWRDADQAPPDAVVIIRGGGAVNDLAWLNDYALAHAVCTLPVPVLTGLGHERDSTILDEVANHAYDTPSKVAAGIEQTVRQRVGEVNAHFQRVIDQATSTTNTARAVVERQITATRAGAERQIAGARHSTAEWIGELQLGATKTVHRADQVARQQITSTERDAQRLVQMARERVPALIADVTLHAGKAVAQSRERTQAHYASLCDVTAGALRRRREAIATSMQDVVGGARRSVIQARSESSAQFQAIAGMGPGRTLQRGFAIVRDETGATVTSAAAVSAGEAVEIEFRDGRVAVQVMRKAEKND
jgi:exodeoxyribonuclease VII large subunit